MDAQTIKKVEGRAEEILNSALSMFQRIEETKTAQLIEDASPEVKALAQKVLGAIPMIGQIEGIVGGLVAAYALAQALGVKPMDANEMAEQEQKFHEGYSAD